MAGVQDDGCGAAPALQPRRTQKIATPHGFFTREGGVSSGIYAGLQCGYGARDDARENVTENRKRARLWLGTGVDTLTTCYQAHTSRAIAVTTPWAPEAAPEADALATATPGLAIGVLTADCAPVLFEDRDGGVVGAAHAGWKGAFSGILEAAIDAMEALGARRERIVAAIGPTIGPASYEVGPEFVERFVLRDRRNQRFFRAATAPDATAEGKAQFDLPAYVQDRLTGAGIADATWIGEDTYAAATLYYSNRRALHEGAADYGRLLSAIVLPRKL